MLIVCLPANVYRFGYDNPVIYMQAELEKAQADATYYQKEAQMAKLGERRPGQEVVQLKKTILTLQRQVTCLEAQLAHCTCGMHSRRDTP